MFKRKVKENFKKDGGFTLAELLIVVAIIAVLAIIAIPIFSTKLENSREETDIANLRSAKAAAVAQYLTGVDFEGNAITSSGFTCYFDANSGNLVTELGNINGYGRGSVSRGGCQPFNMIVGESDEETASTYNEAMDVAGQIIEITIYDSGRIVMEWV